MKSRAILFWSSGKDSAWTLHILRQQAKVEIVALVTNFERAAGRVTMHGVRRELVQAQAREAGPPLWTVELPWPCRNEDYENAMKEIVGRARSEQVSVFAFGDLFLEDIRAYRIRQLTGSGIEPVFPLWGRDTRTLAQEMLDGGLAAVLTCVDPRHLDGSFVGRAWNRNLLAELPTNVDPCGENGEFHTFCHAGPMFQRALQVEVSERMERNGFVVVDLLECGGLSPLSFFCGTRDQVIAAPRKESGESSPHSKD